MNHQNYQYNKYYTNVIYEGKHRRLYDEFTTDSFTALYSETQIKLIEMIEKYKFKIFYISTKPKSNLVISFKRPEYVNLNDNSVINIKKLLSEDIYYFYENKLFEIIYTFPKLNKNNNYSFNILLVVNDSFNLNSLYNYNFNLIEIYNIQPIKVEIISYDWVKNIFEKRNFFHNRARINDEDYIKNYYSLKETNLSVDDFIKNYNNNNEDFDWKKYRNMASIISCKNFNQNLYVKNSFMFLDTQIWSFDREYFKIKNSLGITIDYLEIYNVNAPFITNFAEIIGCKSINSNSLKSDTPQIIAEYCTYCCLSDNYYDQCIASHGLNKSSIKTGFADLSNLELKEEWETWA